MKDFMLEVQFLEGAVAVTMHQNGRPVFLMDEAYADHGGDWVAAAREVVGRASLDAVFVEDEVASYVASLTPDQRAENERIAAKSEEIARLNALLAEQQEIRSRQAVDEQSAFLGWAEREYQTGPDEELNLKHVDVIQNRKGWMARAALATQPAASEPVAWRYKERPDDMRSSWCYAHKRKNVPHGWPFQELYTAPPAAAHGDEAVSFEYVGPNNESKTVEVTREEISDHLDYMLFQKLTVAVCMCDPDDADNCLCDEYAEQFTLRA